MQGFTRVGGLVLVLLVSLVPSSRANFYDVATDWSDSSNPNGAWTYREGANALPHVDRWEPPLFAWDQPAWADSQSGGDRIPAWFKAAGTPGGLDFVLGDMVCHSTDPGSGQGNGPGNIIWTSPELAYGDVSGAVWITRDIGRSVDWAVYYNGVLVTSGNVSSGDAYDRASPFDLSMGSGGPSVLDDILFAAGDTLEFRLTTVTPPPAPWGDLVGVRLAIQTTAVPEPATMSLLVLGVLSSLLRRRWGRQGRS